VILGMARSGTSAVTQMFVSCGFFVARDEDLMPATEDNAGGYWENTCLHRVNEEILSQLSGSWLDPPLPDVQLAAREWAVPALQTEVERILEQADGSPVALKDPRIGVMTPIWGPIIADRFHSLVVVRDPVEIALSLNRRDGTPLALGLAAWELHTSVLLDYLEGKPVTVAPYARLIEDVSLAPLIVEQAAAHLEPERARFVAPAAAGEALEAGFRHNRAPAAHHGGHLTARQLELWEFLSSLPLGNQAITTPLELREPSPAARTGARDETKRFELVKEVERQRTQLIQAAEGARALRAELETAVAAERNRAVELETVVAAEHSRAVELQKVVAAEHNRAVELEARLINEQQRLIAEQERLIAEQERAASATDARLRSEGQLEAITSSASWRITAPLRAARGKLGV